MADQIDTMLTEDQAAAAMGITIDELHDMRDTGDGPKPFAITVHVVRYTPGDVDDWRRSHTR